MRDLIGFGKVQVEAHLTRGIFHTEAVLKYGVTLTISLPTIPAPL
jgi:hypothetical protein